MMLPYDIQSSGTVRKRGFYMPAEWEPHSATWLSYPHNAESFYKALHAAQEAFVEMVFWLAKSETVHINVNNNDMREDLHARMRDRQVDGDVRIHLFPTNDAWCRDHGAIFVVNQDCGQRIAVNWRFNSWGGKYPYELDDRIGLQMAGVAGCECVSIPMVLEGGSIDGNGEGMLLTTEQCLLNPNRNPELDRAAIESIVREALGVTTVLWLAGGIAGDDTDGHVDDVARFVRPDTIVAMIETDRSDSNYAILQENLRRLQAMTDARGNAFRIIAIPMPEPVYFESERLPASYANFYIGNAVVIVPTFACAQDRIAIGTLQELFPERQVVGIDARSLVVGLGTFHCLSQQVPALRG